MVCVTYVSDISNVNKPKYRLLVISSDRYIYIYLKSCVIVQFAPGTAVSYTHLDVYKRQEQSISIIINCSSYKYLGTTFTQDGSLAVSYTHLDVYKRQK